MKCQILFSGKNKKKKYFKCRPLKIVFVSLFVLRFYGPVNPMGHVERVQFT